MKTLRFFAPLIVAAAGLSLLSVSPASAQDKMDKMAPKMGQEKMGKMDKMSHDKMGKMAMKTGPVYACKECKMYMKPAMAKKMDYKDAMGHKYVKMANAPAGYTDAAKMDKMHKMDGDKMGKMDKSGGKM